MHAAIKLLLFTFFFDEKIEQNKTMGKTTGRQATRKGKVTGKGVAMDLAKEKTFCEADVTTAVVNGGGNSVS